jgi:hypothetical protein
MNKYKSTVNLKYLAVGMFIIVSSVMLLVCYEGICEYRNITSFMATEFVPVVYALAILVVVGCCSFKAFYIRK